jgi:hypothetical protein
MGRTVGKASGRVTHQYQGENSKSWVIADLIGGIYIMFWGLKRTGHPLPEKFFQRGSFLPFIFKGFGFVYAGFLIDPAIPFGIETYYRGGP